MPQIPPMTFELQDQGGNVLHSGDLGNLNQLSGLVGMANHFNQHFGEHFGTPMTPMAQTSNLAKDLAVLDQVLRANHQEKKEDEVREIKIQKENPISCHICQAPFPSENLFKSHMITVHETEDVSTNKDDDWTLLDKATTPEKEE